MAMDGRETGTVKAWIEERGMGFVTPSAGGIDHFVHRSMLTDGQSLQVGAPVTFVPNWDAQKDKPIASQITGACPAPGAAGGAAVGGWGALQPREGFEIGTVKAWIDARGMGFITPPDGGEDLFVHRSFLGDGVSLVVGSQVQYVRGWDAQKNKGIAQNISGCSQAQPAPPMKGKGKDFGKGGGGGFGDNLYITGLPRDATDESIRGIFGQYGVVSRCKVLPDNGSTERVALVQMGAPEQAEWLVWNLDGNIPLGLSQVIGVKHHAGNSGKGTQGGMVMPPAWGAQSWGAPAGGPPAPAQPGDNLYISGLPLDTTTESVTTLLGQYGTIVSAKVLETAGKPDKVAMVKFSSFDEAKWVLENLNGNIPAGIDSVIHVKYAASKQPSYAAPKGGDAWGKGGGYGPAKGGDAWGAKGGTGWTSTPYGGKGKGPQNVPPPQHIPPPPAGKKDRLNISGLPADSTEESVMGLIGQYGAVSHVKMLPGSGGPRTAIVQMGEEDSAKWLVETLNNNIPQGIETPVQISFATSTPPPAAGAYGGGGGGAQWSGAPTTGTVKHWVEDRGMGFITPADGGQDCFIHRSDLMDGLSLVVGGQVNFVPGWDNLKQKPTATQVTGAFGGDGVGKGAMKMDGKGKGKGDAGKGGLW